VKEVVKQLVDGLALLLMGPAALLYGLGALLLGREKAFPGWSQAVSLVPGLTGIYLRRAFYRWVLPECGRDACIGFGTIFSHPTARIGRSVYLGPYCMVGDVTLEPDVLVGAHVSITNGSAQHGIDRLDVPIREQPGSWPRITIGQDTWIGDRTVVMADLGRHCVIGAGSVVTRPVPDYGIAVGVPAKVIRWRKESDVVAIESALHEPPEPPPPRKVAGLPGAIQEPT
jgi:acetyltransferase-like isoleucine patch superfamily enzyme